MSKMHIKWISMICGDEQHKHCKRSGCSCQCHKEELTNILELKNDFIAAFAELVYEIWESSLYNDSDTDTVDYEALLETIEHRFGYPETHNEETVIAAESAFTSYLRDVTDNPSHEYISAKVEHDVYCIIEAYNK